MSYFFYGDSQLKINEEIQKVVLKENYSRVSINLSEENFLEIGSRILSENLFGDKYLYILDITDTDNEILEKFFLNPDIAKISNLIVVYTKNLTSASKIHLNFKNYEVKELKENSENIFELADLILKGDITLVYKEIERLRKVDEVFVFNMVVSGFRNIEFLVLGLDQINKIPPFKKGMYQKIAQEYRSQRVKEVSKKLFDLDLRFKTSELTSDMLLTSLIILFRKK